MSGEIARQPEVLPSLFELAVTANEEHALCEEILEPALRGALPHALAAGEALLEARGQIPTGSWQRWLRENFDGSLAAASRYIRIAAYKDLISDANGVKSALEMLKGLPDATPRAGAPRLYGDDIRDAALHALQVEQMTLNEVADTYGVSLSTLWTWAHPDDAAAIRRRWHAKRKKREREAQIKQAVRKAGAALAEAYAMAERMQDVIAQAEQEATSRETRAALLEAGEHYRKMRDEIVRALGVS